MTKAAGGPPSRRREPTSPARTQAERRARSRDALLESAARGLSRGGYHRLSLEHVAAEAGYTRGALYHQFAGKEDLTLAVVAWVDRTWHEEVEVPALEADDPLEMLLAVVRGHVRFCRRDVARVMSALRIEFGSTDHPIALAIDEIIAGLVERAAALITEARARDLVPPGIPAKRLATGLVGAVEGMTIYLRDQTSEDEQLAVNAVLGLLGVPRSTPSP